MGVCLSFVAFYCFPGALAVHRRGGGDQIHAEKGERLFEIHNRPGLSRVDTIVNIISLIHSLHWDRSSVGFGEEFCFFLVSTHTLGLSLLLSPPRALG